MSDYFCLETTVALVLVNIGHFFTEKKWSDFVSDYFCLETKVTFVSWILGTFSRKMKWVEWKLGTFPPKEITVSLINLLCFGRSEETSIRPKMKSLTLRVFASLIDFVLLLLLNYFFTENGSHLMKWEELCSTLALLLITGYSTLKSVTFAWLLFKGKIVVSICDNLLAS